MKLNTTEAARALQEYLEALSEAQRLAEPDMRRHLLSAYGELRFKLQGGGRCAACAAPVRHVLPVAVERDGATQRFPCLCTRCLEAERATAQRVSLRVGEAVIEYAGGSAGLQPGGGPAAAAGLQPRA